VGEAGRYQPQRHGGQGGCGLEGSRGVRPDGLPGGRPELRKRRNGDLRPSDHDPVHAPGLLRTRFFKGEHHHLAGDADEVRDREVRPLQRGGKICLQRRPGFLAGRARQIDQGILMAFPSERLLLTGP
jgi:hypothetical protein